MKRFPASIPRRVYRSSDIPKENHCPESDNPTHKEHNVYSIVSLNNKKENEPLLQSLSSLQCQDDKGERENVGGRLYSEYYGWMRKYGK